MKAIARILLIIVLLLPASLLAETLAEIDVEELTAKKREIVKDSMQLTEKESVAFWPLYNDYDKILWTSFKRYKELIKKYMQERENLSEKKAKEMMNELLEIQTDDLKHKRAYVKKFRDKLPHKRVFQYFVLEEQFEAGFFALVAEELPPIK